MNWGIETMKVKIPECDKCNDKLTVSGYYNNANEEVEFICRSCKRKLK